MADQQPPRLIRRFVEVLGMIARGEFEKSCNEGLRDALEAIRAQPGEKGKATISIEINIAAQGDMVQVTPKLKVKLPDGETFTPLVLWDYDGALSAQHPSQIDMFVKPAPVAGTDAIKDTATG